MEARVREVRVREVRVREPERGSLGWSEPE